MQEDLEVYWDQLISQRIQTFRNTYYEDIKDIRKACFLYPLVLVINAGILWLFNLILDDIPILPTILETFHLDKTLYWISGVIWIICIFWLIIGCIMYPIKRRENRRDLRQAIEKEKAWNPSESEIIVIMSADEFCPMPSWPFEKKNTNKNHTSEKRQNNRSEFSYEKEVKEMNQHSFSYIDGSGVYRRWGMIL